MNKLTIVFLIYTPPLPPLKQQKRVGGVLLFAARASRKRLETQADITFDMVFVGPSRCSQSARFIYVF